MVRASCRMALTSCLALIAGACSPFGEDPDAPASYETGSALPELSLAGYIDRNHDGTLASDEHGPMRPADVAHAYPDAELLLVHVAFEWCKYCWEETTEQIAWTKHYGGRFVSLQIMIQDRDGREATRTLLDSWTRANHSALPTAVETGFSLLDRFGQNATYILVAPKEEMKIIAVGAGPPQFASVREKLRERLGPMPSTSQPSSQ
jgi:hypothetical protein